MNVEKRVQVAAPAEALWAVVSDPVAWPEWTESIDSVELPDGPLALGARARVRQPRLRPMVWTVSELEPGTSFTWRGTSGGVTTVGTHEVIALDHARSELVLGLHQRGALVPAIDLLLGARVRRYVELEAAGLKTAAEQRVRSAPENR